jgi:cytochrome P450
LTFITAGHETTALALTWAFYLLSLHPEVEGRVRQEIDSVTGGAPVDAEHIDALAYTGRVIQEATRLYPPAALIVREARQDVDLGKSAFGPGRLSTYLFTPCTDTKSFGTSLTALTQTALNRKR